MGAYFKFFNADLSGEFSSLTFIKNSLLRIDGIGFKGLYFLYKISRTASKKVRENNLIDDIATKYYQDYKILSRRL